MSQRGFETLADVLRRRAQEQPYDRAFTFLADGEAEAGSLTFAELDAGARAVAAYLQARNGRGERGLLLYYPGLDWITALCGCLYANVVAVPLPPPVAALKHRYLPRLRSVLNDAGARFVLTTSALKDDLGDALEAHPEFRSKEWVLTDRIELSGAARWKYEPAASEDIAYLQYTSGSTSQPKGVMITQANIMSVCAYDTQLIGLGPGTITVCWMPYFHDYGLVDGMLLPLYNGTPCYLMAPLAFVQRPIRWLRAITRYRATHSSAPNFSYELCVRKITPQERATLDLRSWRTAGNAAEPIRSRTLEQFAAAFSSCGFEWESHCPAWGLAESTLIVTARRGPRLYHMSGPALAEAEAVEVPPDRPQTRTLVGCGCLPEGSHNVRIRIVDPQSLLPVPDGRIGEIWVQGDLVAKGYWNRPEATVETFGAFDRDGDGPFMRTGDLAFMRGPELVFAGRLKDLIIIEGRNHYPQDIEKTAEESHPALRPGCSAAFSIDSETSEQLILAAEIRAAYHPADGQQSADGGIPLSEDEVVRAIRRAVAEEHGIHVHDIVLLPSGGMDKTSSGKIQRSACRARYLAGGLERWPDTAVATRRPAKEQA